LHCLTWEGRNKQKKEGRTEGWMGGRKEEGRKEERKEKCY